MYSLFNALKWYCSSKKAQHKILENIDFNLTSGTILHCNCEFIGRLNLLWTETYHCTGLYACCSKYGERSLIKRFGVFPRCSAVDIFLEVNKDGCNSLKFLFATAFNVKNMVLLGLKHIIVCNKITYSVLSLSPHYHIIVTRSYVMNTGK